MKLSLSIVRGTLPQVWVLDEPPIGIGRERGNSVQIRHHSVSRRHAEIARRSGRLWITDLHSHNGTWLNGVRLLRPAALRPGDRVQLGRVTLVVSECSSRFGSDDRSDLEGSTVLEAPPAEVIGMEPRNALDAGQLVRDMEAFARRLVGAPTLPAVYEAFLSAVEGALPTTRLLLFVGSDPKAEVELVASRPRIPCLGDPPIVDMATLRAASQRGHVLLISDARGQTSTRVRHRSSAPVPTAIAVPLVSEGRPIGLAYAEHTALAGGYRREHAELLTLFANLVAVRISKTRAAKAATWAGQIQHEIAVAGQIQRWLLPDNGMRIAGYDIHAVLEPYDAVGGDFYDFYTDLSGDVWIVLGDVSGHGICAAIVMSVLLSSARALYDECAGPAELMRRLNAVLQGQGECGRFATAFVARLDPDSGAMDYVNAGHTHPLLVTGRRIRELASNGPALGWQATYPYLQESTTVGEGDLLAIFTDGIPEARRSGKRFFGGRRLAGAIRRAARESSLETGSRKLLEDVDRYLAGAPRSDDIALLLLRRRPAPSH